MAIESIHFASSTHGARRNFRIHIQCHAAACCVLSFILDILAHRYYIGIVSRWISISLLSSRMIRTSIFLHPKLCNTMMGDTVSQLDHVHFWYTEPGGNAFAGQRGVAHTEAKAARGAQRTLEAECEIQTYPVRFSLQYCFLFLLFGSGRLFWKISYQIFRQVLQKFPDDSRCFPADMIKQHDRTGRSL